MHTSSTCVSSNISSLEPILLTPDFMKFLSALVNEFSLRREKLLEERKLKQQEYDQGYLPHFSTSTQSIRDASWKIKSIPADLCDRRVEITGPAERKMIINALNANVKVFMADFEDSLSPTWENLLQGQINLQDAVKGSIKYDDPLTRKQYRLNQKTAVLMCRPRGLHLIEKHITRLRKPISASLFDFALYFYFNHALLLHRGSGPYFYLPKLQGHQEAAWWNDVFCFSEDYFRLQNGTIKATVLIETLPAVFEMEEILYELRDHIVGLNCGRWDYIFSYIKTLHKFSDRVLPDRQTITMDKPFLNAYSRLLIKTCHRRGALAMGGMSAFIPSKNSEENERIFSLVKLDKEREAKNGHDGTWIAHPGLADIAMQAFNRSIPDHSSNQLHVTREEDVPILADDLLQPIHGEFTEKCLRNNMRVAIKYLASWLNGQGCVPIYGLMEDAATAEISRTSIWQWIQHGAVLDNGHAVNKSLFEAYLNQELHVIQQEVGENHFANNNYLKAASLFKSLTLSDQLIDFLTLPGYEHLEDNAF